jgi:tetratricopeptide (TPR) repeat protein
MEQRADRRGEVVGLIADHLELAGEQDEAFRYLKLSGVQAAEKYANDEAVDYFSRALVMVPEENLETRFDLLLNREGVLDLQSKREAQRQDLENLESLAKELGSAEKQMEVGVRLSSYQHMINEFKSAALTAERVVIQADAINNLPYSARGHQRWGISLIWMDEYEQAQDHLEQALKEFRDTNDKHREGATLRYLGLIAAYSMDLQGWQEYAEQALYIARQIGDRSTEAEAINHLAHIYFSLGNYITAQS